jgi:uncharacterized membrane protein (UPF0127 family)
MRFLALAALIALAGCGGPSATTLEDFPTRPLTLPDGKVIRVETMMSTFDVTRGMMFRTSLAPDRGMLFVYPAPDHHSHWMYQTLIPLDMIWMDANRTIVEMATNAQPCKTQASKCPQYGGQQLSNYVLEINGGLARKYGLQLGQTIQW